MALGAIDGRTSVTFMERPVIAGDGKLTVEQYEESV
jgi:hypothetical protein